MKIQEALKTRLIENQHEFTETWETTGYSDSESGTWWNGTQHCDFSMEDLLAQIDLFCKEFYKEGK